MTRKLQETLSIELEKTINALREDINPLDEDCGFNIDTWIEVEVDGLTHFIDMKLYLNFYHDLYEVMSANVYTARYSDWNEDGFESLNRDIEEYMYSLKLGA